MEAIYRNPAGWDSPGDVDDPGGILNVLPWSKNTWATPSTYTAVARSHVSHHENEAAQSRCANDNPGYVRYWLHNGMLNLGSEKMSKSVGNVLTIRSLLEKHSSEVLRYALLSGQYSSSLTWSDDLLAQARASLDSLYQGLRDAVDTTAQTSTDMENSAPEEFPLSVVNALCDDLNTPKALAAMHDLAADLLRTADKTAKAAIRRQLLAGGWLLGLLYQTAEGYFTQGQPGDLDAPTADAIEALIAQRKAARADGDYAGADRIRDELLAAGIELEDSREGTRWRKI